MRLISLCILCAVLAALPARAEDAVKRALAEELLTSMDIQKNTEKSFEMMKKMIVQQSEQAAKMVGAPGASTNAAAESAAMLDLVMQEMSWEKLKDRYINLYADTFTEEELKGVIDFYNSPAGKAFTAKQPELMKRTMEMTQQIMMDLLPKIQAMTAKKTGLKVAPAAASPAPAAAGSPSPAPAAPK